MSEHHKNLKLKKLQLTNFRNLNSEIIEFSPNINCIFGENGNGKTNLLEGIYFLINRRSFKKNINFSQILSMDAGESEIRLMAIFEEINKELISYSGKYNTEHSIWYANGFISKKKMPIETVFINPFDSHAFHTTASFRRDWFDRHISMFDIEYKFALKKYIEILKFRNTLLAKKPAKFREQIAAIDPELILQAETLVRLRLSFIEKIQNQFTETFKKIFSQSHLLRIALDTKLVQPYAKNFHRILEENKLKDELLGHTSYGVHKDDYQFKFDGVNAFEYCSLGQQKMSYLSMLFAYIELFRYKLSAYPIVLIDDVSGELDSSRWKRLIQYLKECEFQVLITTANENFREELEQIDGTKVMRIRIIQGAISKL